MEPKEEIRVYSGADSKMTEAARTILGLLTTDIAAFTAFDSTMNGVFLTDYENAINDADTVVADTAVIDQLVSKTETVIEVMDTARSKYRDVKYFVQKAFPNSVGIQGEFGLNDYDRARKSTAQMIQFLNEMFNACTKYSAALITAGYNQLAIDEIKDIRDKLQLCNLRQEVFKKERPKLTEDRIIILNKCYNMMVQVNAAAQLVFRDDYAKQKQYVYSAAPGNTVDEEEFEGTVAPTFTKTITAVGAEDAVYTFRNTGLVPLVFCLSVTEDGEAAIPKITIGGGAIVTQTSADMDPDGTAVYLLVNNPSTSTEGSYKVQINI